MRALVFPFVVVATILGINPTYAQPGAAPARPGGAMTASRQRPKVVGAGARRSSRWTVSRLATLA